MVRNKYLLKNICSVWICKGDLNKHHNNNSNPMQSYLFCIKAFFYFFLLLKEGGDKIQIVWSLICLEKYYLFCFNRKFIFIWFSWEFKVRNSNIFYFNFHQLCIAIVPWKMMCCWKKNYTVMYIILFSDHFVPITASGPQG